MNPAVQEATRAQNASANPARSTFVSANAGSGKTTILTKRMARLLLAGVRPESILCLTFTKAASAEVQERVFGTLGEWVLMQEDELRHTLEAIGERKLDDQSLKFARQLFAQALETPSGLKVQTIHAFSAGLLRRFPLEAGVPPDFREMDESESEALCFLAMQNVVANHPDLAREIAQRRALGHPLVKTILSMRGQLRPDWSAAQFAHALGLKEPMPLAEFQQSLDEFADLDTQENLLLSLKTGQPKFAKSYLEKRRRGIFDFDNLRAFFIKTDGQPRKNVPAPEAKFLSPTPTTAALTGIVLDEGDRVISGQYTQAQCLLHQFADLVLRDYQRQKSLRLLLDYDDLIDRADQLLNQNDRLNWVMYRLDSRINHILVDEAQDTNEAQWRIIDAIAHLVFQNDDTPRTLFVVGDEKQSIYSFQGADPTVFEKRRLHYRQGLLESETPLQEEELLVSFRSSPLILDYVDQVFKSELQAGLGAKIEHQPRSRELPGQIEILPYLWQKENDPPIEWPEIGIRKTTSAALDLAEQIANKIAQDIQNGASLPDEKTGSRARRAGDYLILLRKRDAFFYFVQKSLMEKGVPIAGVDKLKLNEELAIKDIIALFQAVQSPYDDLSLARFLRSPLGGLSEIELYNLAVHRSNQPLLQALEKSHHQAALSLYQDIRKHADYQRPHDLILRVLRNHQGEAKLRARLGVAVGDALRGFLEKALQYEQSQTPSLIGFLNWFQNQQIELRRTLSETENAVRVMTIHGAKGLEAPIVILPFLEARNNQSDWIFTHQNIALSKGSYAPIPAELHPEIEAENRRAQEEENRLSYVALTRARSELIICGSGPKTQQSETGFKEGHIYPILQDAALSLPYNKEIEGEHIRIQFHWPHDPSPSKNEAQKPLRQHEFPPITRAPATPIFSLSELLPEHHGAHGRGAEYGTLFHAIMENIIHWPKEQTPEFAQARFGDQPHFTEAFAEAKALLKAHPFLLQKPNLQEMDFSLSLPNAQIQGRMDHIVLGDEIIIIDYKTNLQIAHLWQDLSPNYQQQLAVYAHAAKPFSKGKNIRAMILWSQDQSALEATPEALEQAYGEFLQNQKFRKT